MYLPCFHGHTDHCRKGALPLGAIAKCLRNGFWYIQLCYSTPAWAQSHTQTQLLMLFRLWDPAAPLLAQETVAAEDKAIVSRSTPSLLTLNHHKSSFTFSGKDSMLTMEGGKRSGGKDLQTERKHSPTDRNGNSTLMWYLFTRRKLSFKLKMRIIPGNGRVLCTLGLKKE